MPYRVRLDQVLRTGNPDCWRGITADSGGNMIYIERTTDFEFYSSTSAGAIQGYGYVYHAGWYSSD
jgi:hypothetical protein